MSHKWQLLLNLLSRMAKAKNSAIASGEGRQEWQLALVGFLRRIAEAGACVDHCIGRQPVPAKRSKLATRIGLPQQNGGVRSENGHHVLQSSVTACEKGHKWQLALDSLAERRKHSGSETGCGLRHSTPARRSLMVTRIRLARRAKAK